MDIREWKSAVLHKMGFIQPMSAGEICRAHNGVQAQFQVYADRGFQSRMRSEDFAGNWSADIVRQWSLRGTVHAYLKEEIPLYLYRDRLYLQPFLHQPSRDGSISAAEKRYFADVILDHLQDGNKSREELKDICRAHGMTEAQEAKLLNAWGGIFAALIAEGMIYQEYGRRYFGLLKDYVPWEKDAAERTIAARYFSGFGAVSLADARYYFKETKARVEDWMRRLDLSTVEVDGKTRYYLGKLTPCDIPKVIFVAGFDALLLAFEKRENPFFDTKHIRDIYTMTGILKPTVMLDGTLVATWRLDRNKARILPFTKLKATERRQILAAAKAEFGDAEWEE